MMQDAGLLFLGALFGFFLMMFAVYAHDVITTRKFHMSQLDRIEKRMNHIEIEMFKYYEDVVGMVNKKW